MAYVDPNDPKSPPNYYGVTLVDKEEAGSGNIAVPENIQHSYDTNGDVLILTAGAFSNGTVPDHDPPLKNRAPGYKRLKTPAEGGAPYPVVGLNPMVVWNKEEIATSAGYGPGGAWYKIGDKSGSPSGDGPGLQSTPGTLPSSPAGGQTTINDLTNAAITYATAIGYRKP